MTIQAKPTVRGPAEHCGIASRLRHYTPHRLRVSQELLRCPRVAQVDAPAGETTLFIAGAPTAASDIAELRGSGPGVLLLVHSGPAAFSDCGPAWTDLRGDARLAAWSLAHEPLLQAINALVGQSLLPHQLRAFRHGDMASADRVWVSVMLAPRDAPTRIQWRGALGLPVASAEHVLVNSEASGTSDWLARFGHLRTEVTVTLRAPKLTMAHCLNLEPGDVIVLGTGAHVLRHVCLGMPGETVPLCTAQFTADGLQLARSLTSTDTPEEPGMEDTTTETDAPRKATAPPGGIPVSLHFEVGKLRVSLDELATLQPGYVFELSAPVAGDNVRILAGDRALAAGELVVANERLGVRIVRWLDNQL